MLEEEEPEKYQSHFAKYLKDDLDSESLEDLYSKVHEAIRADPSPQLTEKNPPGEKRRSTFSPLPLPPLLLPPLLGFLP